MLLENFLLNQGSGHSRRGGYQELKGAPGAEMFCIGLGSTPAQFLKIHQYTSDLHALLYVYGTLQISNLFNIFTKDVFSFQNLQKKKKKSENDHGLTTQGDCWEHSSI